MTNRLNYMSTCPDAGNDEVETSIAPPKSPNVKKAPSGPVDYKKRYEMARVKLYNDLPRWKQLAIDEDIRDGKESRFADQFAKDVVALAEDTTQEIFLTT